MEKTLLINHLVTSENSGKRLDLILVLIQSQKSRSSIRKLIDLGEVHINNNVEFRPNYKVKVGDLITMKLNSGEESELKLKPQNIPLDIVFEDTDLLVINKPSGMVIHPATGNESDTLMNAVMFYLGSANKVGDGVRGGLIHRIDKDTSGLVLIGKTNRALWYYSRLFADRQVSKQYTAIVAGNMLTQTGKSEIIIKNYIGRLSSNRKKFGVVQPKNGRIAETRIELVKVVKNLGVEYSIVNAFPKTGRTHQIRVHLTSIGLPILGDVIYGKANSYPRLMLHAHKIQLKHLSGKEVEFVAALPNDFNLN